MKTLSERRDEAWASIVKAAVQQKPSVVYVNPEFAIEEGWITREQWDAAHLEDEEDE